MTFEEIDTLLDARNVDMPEEVTEDAPADTSPEPEPIPETDLVPVRDLILPASVQAKTRQVWEQALAAHPDKLPTVREVRAKAGGSWDRVRKEVLLLNQEHQARPAASDAVAAAKAGLAAATQGMDAFIVAFHEAEAAVTRCDEVVADLIRRASMGDVEAAAQIEAAQQALWLAHRKVSVQMPLAKEQLQQDEDAAGIAVVHAERERDLAHYNALGIQRRNLCLTITERRDALIEVLVEYLGLTQAHRDVATSLGVPLGTPGESSPEHLLAAFIQSRLERMAPPKPSRLHGMPDVPDLVARDASMQPLSAEQVRERAGTGTVFLAYAGPLVVNLAEHGIRRDLQTQSAFQHKKAVRFSLDEAEALRVKYGNDLVVVPPPVWE